MECHGVTLPIFIVKVTNLGQFKCVLLPLMMILWHTNFKYMLLASNYVRNHTKMYKKLKSDFEFSDGSKQLCPVTISLNFTSVD